MASIRPPINLNEGPRTPDMLLNLAQHLTVDLLLNNDVPILNPFVAGVLPDGEVRVMQANTPLCSIDFLVAAQHNFRMWGVDRYFYVTPTSVQAQVTIPAICTIAVTAEALKIRYVTFNRAGVSTYLSTVAEHQYARPEHFPGPFSQLLSTQNLAQLNTDSRQHWTLH